MSEAEDRYKWEERTEEPTPSKLKSLREQGLVPQSRISIAAVATLLTGVAISTVLSTSLSESWQCYADQLSLTAAPWQLTLEQFADCGRGILTVVFMPLFIAAIAALVWGLIQSAGLFYFPRLFPGFSAAPKSGAAVGFLSPFLALVVVAGSAFLALRTLHQVAGPIARSQHPLDQRSVAELAAVIGGISSYLLFALFVLAIVAYLIDRWRFMRQHRMTRQERLSDDAR